MAYCFCLSLFSNKIWNAEVTNLALDLAFENFKRFLHRNLPKMARFSYKASVSHDIALLLQTESVNPFSVSKKKAKPIWEEVASKLQQADVQLAGVNSRNCRERVEVLLKEFRAEEQLSIKS
jgi:hypothetical protein